MKKVLFLTRLFTPHIGGVETHVLRVAQILQKNGFQMTIITEQYDESLNEYEMMNGIEIYRIPFVSIQSKAKLWSWLWSHRKLFKEADVVHVHDVFWWVFPVLTMIKSKYFVTFHGWEGSFPPKKTALFQRKAAAQLSRGVIQVGEYIQKWYGTSPDVVTYGGVDLPAKKNIQVKSVLKKVLSAAKVGQYAHSMGHTFDAIFVGRLSADNDVKKVADFFSLIKEVHPKAKFLFVGDGPFAGYCESIGTVTGFVPNVSELMNEANIVCANSYLSIMQAQAQGKLVCSFFSNPLKQEYLEQFPQAKNMIIAQSPEEGAEKLADLRAQPTQLREMIRQASEWAQRQSWDKVAQEYEELWKV